MILDTRHLGPVLFFSLMEAFDEIAAAGLLHSGVPLWNDKMVMLGFFVAIALVDQKDLCYLISLHKCVAILTP